MNELKEIDDDTIDIPLTDKVIIYDDEKYVPAHRATKFPSIIHLMRL